MSDLASEANKSATNSTIEVNKVDLLWKVIQRFDFYINSTNTKASAIIAFNTFVVSGIVLKASELLPVRQDHHVMAVASSISLLIAAIASFIALGITFSVISPFLKSSEKHDRYVSNLFFAHIATFDEPNKFYQQIQAASHEGILQDLSTQIHSLAQGLDGKFNKIKIAFQIIIFFQLPAFSFVILIKLFSLTL